MEKNIDYSESKRMQSADMKSDELKKSRQGKMHRVAGRNVENFPRFSFFKKPATSSDTNPFPKELAYEAKTKTARKSKMRRFSRKKLEKLKEDAVLAEVGILAVWRFSRIFVFFRRPFFLEIIQNIVFRKPQISGYF